MVKFELKKVFCKTSSKIAVILLAGIVALSCWLAVSGVQWVNEKGEEETGFTAISHLKQARNEWEGYLDENMLKKVIVENERINATPEYQSKDYEQNDIAYSWKQGIRKILDMMNYSYGEGFRNYDYYVSNNVSADEAGEFYSNRVKLLKEWLNDETDSAYELYTENEKEYLIQQYEELETPIYLDYEEGWGQLLYCSTYIIMIGALILGYLVAGIFSNEFKWKSDAIFYTTVYGRNKATSAKIKAGFLLVTGMYWSAILIYTLITLGCLGFEGSECPIQIEIWKCFYNLTLGQTYLLVVVGGYIGNLFLTFLTMWVSSKTKSSIFAVTVPFILIFMPSFLDNIGNVTLSKVLGVFPDQLLQIYQGIRYFNVYEIGGYVFSAMFILVVLYSILTVVMVPVCYQEFRHKQVS